MINSNDPIRLCDNCGKEFELDPTSMAYTGEVDICEPCVLEGLKVENDEH